MKTGKASYVALFMTATLICIMTVSCGSGETGVYNRIRHHTDEIKVIDTHSHMHFPKEYGDHEFSLYHLIAHNYLMADLISAGSPGYDLSELDTITPEEFWGRYGRALDFCRTTSYYGYLVRGFQKLYGFNEKEFTPGNISALASQVKEKNRDEAAWFDEAFNAAGFDLMFLCTSRFTIPLDKKYYVVSYYVDRYIRQAARKPAAGSEPKDICLEAAWEGYTMESLDEYLGFCDHMLRKYIDNRGVCIKNGLAYSRTLYYEDVPYEEAKRLYAKPSADLSAAEAKKLEDFMFHWFIRKSIEYNLPVQIHTGYFADNGNTLENGYPLKLNNLFLQYPKARFVLFHGGFPWTGESAALGKMFPNVYLDLVWIPQISREKAVQSLDVMLDCVPYNKFFWGGDCNNIEGEVGALEYGKDVVAEVLAKRVKRGLLSEETAMEITDRIFRENAVELFKLDSFLQKGDE
jgi:hypothetical protein